MVEPATRALTELRDDPWAWSLKNAPLDDEEYTEEELKLLDDRTSRARSGTLVPHSEVERMLAELCDPSSGQPKLSKTS
jgi:hypothetical protein